MIWITYNINVSNSKLLDTIKILLNVQKKTLNITIIYMYNVCTRIDDMEWFAFFSEINRSSVHKIQKCFSLVFPRCYYKERLHYPVFMKYVRPARCSHDILNCFFIKFTGVKWNVSETTKQCVPLENVSRRKLVFFFFGTRPVETKAFFCRGPACVWHFLLIFIISRQSTIYCGRCFSRTIAINWVVSG